MTAEQQLLANTLSKTKRNWCIAMLFGVLYWMSTHPPETVYVLIPIGVVSYFGSIIAAIAYVGSKIKSQTKEAREEYALLKIQEEVRNGVLKAGSEEMFERMREAGVAEISDVGLVSDEILGSFRGEPIHAWIELMNPETGRLTRFEYHAPGDYEEGGTPIIPDEDGKIFAHFNGVVYVAHVG